MLELVLATANPHKARELAALLPDLPVRWLALADFPGAALPEETGATLEDNARLKAEFAAKASKRWALADDTGLEVDALGGAPGVYSARYCGRERDYCGNNEKLLSALQHTPDGKRTARFRTVVALASPQGELLLAQGELRGTIVRQPRGEEGFGYDPLFAPEGSSRTLAQLAPAEKNRISHRAAAIKNAIPLIRAIASGKS